LAIVTGTVRLLARCNEWNTPAENKAPSSGEAAYMIDLGTRHLAAIGTAVPPPSRTGAEWTTGVLNQSLDGPELVDWAL
jgi:hypothetical protein